MPLSVITLKEKINEQRSSNIPLNVFENDLLNLDAYAWLNEILKLLSPEAVRKGN